MMELTLGQCSRLDKCGGYIRVGKRRPTQVQAVWQDQGNSEKATNDRARFLPRKKDFMREYGGQRGMR